MQYNTIFTAINAADGIRAEVSHSGDWYSVRLIDTDSGNALLFVKSFRIFEDAAGYALHIANIDGSN